MAEAIIKCVQIVIPNTEQQSIFISEIINNILHTDTKTAAEIETVTTEVNVQMSISSNILTLHFRLTICNLNLQSFKMNRTKQ